MIGKAFIKGEVGSMIDGRFSYVEGRRSALFSLFLGAVGFAEEVLSIDGGFILSHLFRLGFVG